MAADQELGRHLLAELGRPAEKAIEECEQSLEAYAARVYAEEGESR